MLVLGRMRIFNPDRRRRVLAIGAHPEDLEAGAGGLLARLAQEGAEVTMAIVAIPDRLPERTRQVADGAALLGARRAVVLFPDQPHRVEDIPMHALVARLDQVVAEVSPELVITHALDDLHWDDALTHRATISALRRTPCDLLGYLSTPTLNARVGALGACFADIATTIETKLAAIASHARRGSHPGTAAWRDLARALGRIGGLDHAEVFDVLRVRV